MEAAVSEPLRSWELLLMLHSEEEEPDEYALPLTLKTKKGSGTNSPAPMIGGANGAL